MPSQPLDNDDHQKIVRQVVKQLKEDIRFISKHSQANIVLGDTKQGKSAFVNFICGYKMFARRKTRMGIESIVLSTQQGFGLLIGSSRASQTFRPQKLESLSNNQVIFWDSPGFYDTRGSKQEIMNSFYIQKLFQRTQYPKIIMVVSHQKFGMERGNSFIEIFQKLANLFEDIQMVKKCSCVIFSKVPQTQTVQTLREYIKQLIFQLSESFINKQRTKCLLQHFATSGHIQIFYKPSVVAGQNATIMDFSNTQNIFKMIKMVQPSSQKNIKVLMSSNAQNILHLVVMDITKKVEQLINKLSISLLKIFRNLTRSEKTIRQSKDKIKLFEKVVNQMNKKQNIDTLKQLLITIKNKRYDQFEQEQKFILKDCKNIQEYIQILQWVIKLVPESNIHCIFRQKKQQPQRLSNFIENLLTQPTCHKSNNGQELKIIGHLFGIYDVNKILQRESKTKIVTIFSTCTFYIDQDINLPGVTLHIFSRNLVSDQNRQFILRGKNGQDYKFPAQNAKKYEDDGAGKGGQDGKPGLPGQNGGKLLIRLISNYDEKDWKAKVDIQGGNGGRGQNGGNGGNGKQIQVQNINQTNQKKILQLRQEDLRQRKLICKQQIDVKEKIKDGIEKVLSWNSTFQEEYFIKATQGNKGGNAGKGGAGGKPGRSGKFKFIKNQVQQSMLDKNIKMENKKGSYGQRGLTGEVGKGSKNSSDVKGIYINSKIFAFFRNDCKQKKNNLNQIQQNQATNLKEEKEIDYKNQLRQKLQNSLQIQLIQQHALSAFKQSPISLRLGLCAAHFLLSCILTKVSSQWKVKPELIDTGYAKDGEQISDVNQKDIKQPQQIKQFTNDQIQKLQRQYLSFEKYTYSITRQIQNYKIIIKEYFGPTTLNKNK